MVTNLPPIAEDKTPASAGLPHIYLVQSLLKQAWVWRPHDARLAEALTQRHLLPPLLAQILVGRGVGLDEAPHFMHPKLRDWLPDPFHFKDMDKAIARLVQAVQQKQHVALFGDYDVDGATSTALMARYLRQVGLTPTLYIPDRVAEGYGPNAAAFDKLQAQGHDLVVCLDCGTSAFEPLAHASSHGLDVVVLDHHLGESELPQAVAVVNPNRLDETTPHRYLCAVGVAFMTLVALQKALRAADFFSTHNITEPDLFQNLDLVALGTVCDVVPLQGLNRAFVQQGLSVMAKRQNAGLRTLCDNAGLQSPPTAYHLGFVLGPRLNAGGRVEESMLAVNLLACDDNAQAQTMADTMERLNKQRQADEQIALAEAIAQVENNPERHKTLIMVADAAWHPGLMGLLASRLKEKFQRPACSLSLLPNGLGKASARSVTGLDFGTLVHAAKADGWLETGGGHAMAAGFSVAATKINDLHDYWEKLIEQKMADKPIANSLELDATLTIAAINAELAQNLSLLEPHGSANPAPKLLLRQVRIAKIDWLKEGQHARIIATDPFGQHSAPIMLFRASHSQLGPHLQQAQRTDLWDMVVTVKLNVWQGRTQTQVVLEDMALAKVG